MTLTAIITLIVSLTVFGIGAWLMLAGSVGLALGEFEPLRLAVGEALFIRLAVAMILVGFVLALAGATASARLMT